VARSVAELPAGVWRALQVREGATGRWSSSSRRCESGRSATASRVPRFWLLVRRSLERRPEVKYYVSNAEAETTLEVLALVACSRHEVEEFFEDCKGYLGMAQYETRSWTGWHHHMTLVALAHLFVTLTRLGLKKSAGVDAGSDGEIAGGGVRGAGVETGASDRPGGLSCEEEQGGQSIT